MAWRDPSIPTGDPRRSGGLGPALLPRRRRPVSVTVAAGQLLGIPVPVAVPLQLRRPDLVLAVSLAELAAAGLLVATASLAALALLVLVSLVLVIVNLSNGRQVLAITSQGVVALAASKQGLPRAVIGPVPPPLALPEPTGIGQPVDVGGTTWWVDRSAFRFLRHARELLQADSEDDGGEGEDDRRQHGDAVQVALDHRRPGGRRTEATSEHLREAAAAPAVEEDQHDQSQ